MGENQNSAKISFPSWGKTRKQQKTVFPCEGKRNNSKNWLSPAGESQKMLKIIHRSWAKCRKCEKQRFACKRRAKNAENGPSLVSEMQKTLKTAFRSQATSKKTGKVGLRDIPKGWNSEKQCFGMPRRLVFGENEPSGGPEASKFQETSFRGVPKLGKFEKTVLGMPRKGQIRYFQAQSAGWRLKTQGVDWIWLPCILQKTPLQLLS